MKEGKNVFVWGTFDILHEGHGEYFEAARALGDNLYAIALPDKYLAEHKKRIVQGEDVRKKNLLNYPLLSGTFIDSLHDNFRCFTSVRPDVFCFGYDQKTEWEDKLIDYLKKHFPECEIVRLPAFAKGIHSSHLRNPKLK